MNYPLEDISGESGVGGLMVKWSSLDLLTEDDAECMPQSSFSDRGTIHFFQIFVNQIFSRIIHTFEV